MRDYEKLIVDLQKMKSTEYCVIASQEDFKAYKILRDAICAIEELLAAVPRWISVEDELPELGQKVFTLGPRGALDCGKFIGLVGTRRTDWKDCRWQRFGARKIRFWMPTDFLPAPPKEDAE